MAASADRSVTGSYLRPLSLHRSEGSFILVMRLDLSFIRSRNQRLL